LESLIENHDLQKVLKEDQDFQNLICTLVNLNKTDRTYIQDDPWDKVKGVSVLNSSVDSVDCLFLHMYENPFLSVRSLPASSSLKRKRS
jgi:hypothetical protein